jgi:hypothetical protein
LDVEGDAGDDAQGAPKVTAAARKRSPSLARENCRSWSVGGDHLHGGDGGGEVAVVDAGAGGGGGTGSGDGDLGERGEVVEGEALALEVGGEFGVGDAASDGDGAGLSVDVHRGEVLERRAARRSCRRWY